jgi:hypothetical protein
MKYYNEEQQKAIDDLYAKYGNDQSDEQKIHILQTEICKDGGGKMNISSTSDWRYSAEHIAKRNVAMLQGEFLISQGLFKPTYC